MRPRLLPKCLWTAASALAVCPPTLPAQSPDHLVGLTRNAPFLRHVAQPNCGVLGQCGLPGMPPSTALPPYVGGTAWDPVQSGAWVSNGLLLGRYGDTCGLQCPPNAIPTLAANAYVTGLEVVEGMGQLWLVDSLGNLHYFSNACPWTPLGGCYTGLAPSGAQSVTTALAVDEGRGLVFIAYPDFASGTNTIMVRDLAAPCLPLSQFTLTSCAVGFGTVTGLACDWGKNLLYATDGLHTMMVSYSWTAPTVTLGPPSCCGFGAVDPLIGLALRPGGATSTGTSCASGSCPPCPMNLDLANDPSLGNPHFRLDLQGAPAASFAWCLIGQGPCLTPGLTAAPFCGPVHTVPFLGALGASPTGGTGVCDGSAGFDLALPVNASLAGAVFSSQCITLCFAGGVFGVAQSNCVSWELQGN